MNVPSFERLRTVIATDSLSRIPQNLSVSLNGYSYLIPIVVAGWKQEEKSFQALQDTAPSNDIYDYAAAVAFEKALQGSPASSSDNDADREPWNYKAFWSGERLPVEALLPKRKMAVDLEFMHQLCEQALPSAKRDEVLKFIKEQLAHPSPPPLPSSSANPNSQKPLQLEASSKQQTGHFPKQVDITVGSPVRILETTKQSELPTSHQSFQPTKPLTKSPNRPQKPQSSCHHTKRAAETLKRHWAPPPPSAEPGLLGPAPDSQPGVNIQRPKISSIIVSQPEMKEVPAQPATKNSTLPTVSWADLIEKAGVDDLGPPLIPLLNGPANPTQAQPVAQELTQVGEEVIQQAAHHDMQIRPAMEIGNDLIEDKRTDCNTKGKDKLHQVDQARPAEEGSNLSAGDKAAHQEMKINIQQYGTNFNSSVLQFSPSNQNCADARGKKVAQPQVLRRSARTPKKTTLYPGIIATPSKQKSKPRNMVTRAALKSAIAQAGLTESLQQHKVDAAPLSSEAIQKIGELVSFDVTDTFSLTQRDDTQAPNAQPISDPLQQQQGTSEPAQIADLQQLNPTDAGITSYSDDLDEFLEQLGKERIDIDDIDDYEDDMYSEEDVDPPSGGDC